MAAPMIAEERSLMVACINRCDRDRSQIRKSGHGVAAFWTIWRLRNKHQNHPKEDAMPTSRFIQRFGDRITGVLSGFDRLVLRGSLLAIVSVQGMKRLLWLKHVWLKDFGRWAQQMTEQLKEASCQAARDQNRPIVYLRSANTDKDEAARKIAAEDGITTRLVAILTCVEPGMSFEIYRNPQAGTGLPSAQRLGAVPLLDRFPVRLDECPYPVLASVFHSSLH